MVAAEKIPIDLNSLKRRQQDQKTWAMRLFGDEQVAQTCFAQGGFQPLCPDLNDVTLI